MISNLSRTIESARATIFSNQAAVVMPAVLAILFGTFLVYGTGFAYPSALEAAAHDVRHAFVFACH